MQCPHHSNRLCPAYRSHPRPDHQPCPPPSPCESHPRHRAAPAVFQTSAASCGAKRFQHAGRVARTASQRAPRESNLIPAPSTVAALSAVRQRARRRSHHGAQNGLCRVPRPPAPDKMARVAREAYRARALSGTPSRSPASGGNIFFQPRDSAPCACSPSPSTTRKPCRLREGSRYRTAPPRALTHSSTSCIGHSGSMKNAGLSAL